MCQHNIACVINGTPAGGSAFLQPLCWPSSLPIIFTRFKFPQLLLSCNLRKYFHYCHSYNNKFTVLILWFWILFITTVRICIPPFLKLDLNTLPVILPSACRGVCIIAKPVYEVEQRRMVSGYITVFISRPKFSQQLGLKCPYTYFA
jgi:hypothetical protein